MAEASKERKLRTYAWMGVQPGHKVLDVGCGAGMDTIPLAQIAGPTGLVVGIDLDEAMLVKADELAREAGVDGWVEHRLGDAASMPFEGDTFDAQHNERLFMHLPNPEQVLSEMVRVAKPGGTIVVIDMDGATISIDTTENDIERRFTPFWCALHENPYAGRQLYRLFITAGLVDVAVHVTPIVIHDLEMARYSMKSADVEEAALKAGAVTQKELDRLNASAERAAEIDAFYCSFDMVTVVGRKA
jgi:ubiquinone/menaquinone biosynthesis C-methylase UbiE